MNANYLRFLAGLLLVCAGCSTKPPDNGLGPFEGDWIVLELNEKGEQADAKITKGLQLNFSQGQFKQREVVTNASLASLGRLELSSVRVDNSKSPAEIDFVCLHGPDVGKTKQGIFVFEGSKLKICRGEYDAPRPAAFAPSSESTLMVLERKPAPPG